MGNLEKNLFNAVREANKELNPNSDFIKFSKTDVFNIQFDGLLTYLKTGITFSKIIKEENNVMSKEELICIAKHFEKFNGNT